MADPATATMVATKVIGTIQQQSQARAQARAQQAAINRQIEQQNMQREMREKQQRDQAKRDRASARAAFGARGISSTNGSAGVVVEDITARSEEAIADNRRLEEFGIETLRENQRARRRSNLLEQRNSIFNTVVNTAGQSFLT